jgi:hypothetical protein
MQHSHPARFLFVKTRSSAARRVAGGYQRGKVFWCRYSLGARQHRIGLIPRTRKWPVFHLAGAKVEMRPSMRGSSAGVGTHNVVWIPGFPQTRTSRRSSGLAITRFAADRMPRCFAQAGIHVAVFKEQTKQCRHQIPCLQTNLDQLIMPCRGNR